MAKLDAAPDSVSDSTSDTQDSRSDALSAPDTLPTDAAADSSYSTDFVLQVSSNGRHFVRSDNGKPVLLLMHSGWNVFMYFTDNEADAYYNGVAQAGFTGVLTTLMGWLPEEHKENAYGQEPLVNQDPATPDMGYFQHVDHQINTANSLGLTMVIAPAWKEWINIGPLPRPFDTADKARAFGEWLGQRYKGKNVIWVVGGDNAFDGYKYIVRAMAEGLATGSGGTQMITFHGSAYGPDIPGSVYQEKLSTSYWYADDPWLSFYTTYSGHAWYYPTWYLTNKDYNKLPKRPVLDIEPCYENHPYFADGSWYYQHKDDWQSGKDPQGTPHLIRAQAYWSLLAGACGHAYAYQSYRDFNQPLAYAKYDSAGATQLGLLRKLFESRPWQTLVPDQSIIVEGQDPVIGPDTHRLQAARASDGKFLFVYVSQGTALTVDMSKISGARVKAYWFNPRDGQTTSAGEYDNQGNISFTPPTSGSESDWVLVLDDLAQSYPAPGAV